MQLIEKIRSALSSRISGEISVVEVQGTNQPELMIGTELKEEKALDQAAANMVQSLQATLGVGGGKVDFNNAGADALVDTLRDPLQRAGAQHVRSATSRPGVGHAQLPQHASPLRSH